MAPSYRHEELRLHAAVLLTDSDWTALNDAPLTVEGVNAWRVYRQALRDISQTYLDAADVVWPTQPE